MFLNGCNLSVRWWWVWYSIFYYFDFWKYYFLSSLKYWPFSVGTSVYYWDRGMVLCRRYPNRFFTNSMIHILIWQWTIRILHDENKIWTVERMALIVHSTVLCTPCTAPSPFLLLRHHMQYFHTKILSHTITTFILNLVKRFGSFILISLRA